MTVLQQHPGYGTLRFTFQLVGGTEFTTLVGGSLVAVPEDARRDGFTTFGVAPRLGRLSPKCWKTDPSNRK
jgi:hypothetical protein